MIEIRKMFQDTLQMHISKDARETLDTLWTYINHKVTRYTSDIPKAKVARYVSDT